MVLSDEEHCTASSEADSEAPVTRNELLSGIAYFRPESILEGAYTIQFHF